MAVDIATLQLEIKTNGAQKASDVLAKLEAQSKKTEGATTQMGNKAQKVYEKTRTAAERYEREIAQLNAMRKAGAISESAHKRAIKQAGDEMDRAKSKGAALGNSLRGLGSVLGMVFSVATVGQILAIADKMNVMESQLKSVTQAGDSYKGVYSQVLEIANRNQTAMGSTADLYTKTARAMQPLGATTSQLMSFTDNLSRTMKAAGLSAEDQSGAILQLSQAMGSGRLQGDEFRSIMERAPTVMQALADSMGVPIGQLKKLGSEGAITSDKIFAAFQTLPESVKKIAVPASVSGSWTVLQNNIDNYIHSADKSTGTSKIVAQGIGFMANHVDIILPILGVGLVVALGAATVAMIGFAAATLANPITWIVVGIGVLIGLLVAIGFEVKRLLPYWKQTFNGMVESVKGVVDKIKQEWETLKASLSATIDGVKNAIVAKWEAMNSAIGAKVTALWNYVKSQFTASGGNLAVMMVRIGVDVVTGFWNGLKSTWNSVTAWVTEKFNSVVSMAKQALDSHSPSRKMIKVGEDTMSGFQIGLENGSGSVMDTMNKIALQVAGVKFGNITGAGSQELKDAIKNEADPNGTAGFTRQNRQGLIDIQARAGVNQFGIDNTSTISTMGQELALIGLTTQAAERLNFQRNLEAQIMQMRSTGASTQYITAMEQEAQRTMQSYDIIKQQQAQLEAQAKGDWMAGISKGFDEWINKASDFAGIMQSSVGSALDSISNAFGDLVTKGKADFKSLTASILSDLAKIMMQKAIAGIGSSIMGGLGFSFMAKGGAYDNGIQAFANGGTFTNSIVDSPTLFKFANGTGLMGEAGAEAIMPLSRDSKGRLGVTVNGGQQAGGGVTVTTVVNINQNGESDSKTTTAGTNAQQGKQLGEMIRAVVMETIVTQKRNGGLFA